MYKLKVDLLDSGFHFLGTNARGNTVHMDTSVEQGGSGQGAGPMEMLIMALGGCSGIDILSILRKGRQQVDSFSVDLTAERAEGKIPSPFTKIHAHYALTGELESEKVRRAIELSIEKYCSVAKTLASTAEITFSYTVNTVDYA